MKSIKKSLTLLLAAALILTVFTTVTAKTFPDVDESADYAEAASMLGDLGIFEGDQNGNFNPDATITRAEFAKVLSVTQGAEVTSQTETEFSDVPKEHWASGYIAAATGQGIINGYGDGNFGPDDPVLFEQAVKMIVAAAGFNDEAMAIGGYPHGYIMVAADRGIVKDITAKVDDSALRKTVALLLANSLKYLRGDDNMPELEGILEGKTLELIYEDDFSADKGNLVLEGYGSYEVKDGALYFSDPVQQISGSTVWIDKEFSGDLYVSYNCKAINIDGAKNLNLFFLAKTLNNQDVLSEEHSGSYPDYHKTVNSYILTFTGDYSSADGSKMESGWSRFRKDPGFVMLNDVQSAKSELDKEYFFEIFKVGTKIQVKINGELIHDIEDPDVYEGGKIGFRTWQSDTMFDNFKVYQIK